ncbi:hypothetical protein [Methylotuvimicrobium buryatense]|uniref:Nonribosomal peptide synthetase MxaA n=1 Tax=Methylotuvimicrobium buryatense TaxID=95641 RepID=A0A4P9UTN8_METBY|nr:hypothetical protein [Methylotuvimicrobium buryatense]QCW83980.1 hypothetical protein EQU24_18330 [Methylotuvimicrobium buryatense]
MHKITSTISRLCGGSVTRLTGRREYVRVGLTAAIPAADTCQSSHRTPFQQLSKLFHARSLAHFYLWLLLYLSGAMTANAANIEIELDSPRNYGYSLGDKITLTAHIGVPLFYTLESGFLPAPGSVNEWLRLDSIESIPNKSGKDYSLAITYQVFKSVRATEELTIPPLPIRFMHRGNPETATLPPWTFSYHPLIPINKADRDIEPEPEVPPRLIDATSHHRALTYLLGVSSIILLYIVWFYGKIPFLERYSGSFGKACRELKKLKKLPQSKAVTLQALQCFHHALNELAGETLFAGQLPDFFQSHPKFLTLREKTEALFAISQQLFFAEAASELPAISPAQIEKLCLLYRKLERSGRWI